MKRVILYFCIVILTSTIAYASKVTFKTQSVTVWSQNQLIEGKIDTLITSVSQLYINSSAIAFSFSAADSSFSVPVKLSDGVNKIFVQYSSGGILFNSDTLSLTLGYKLHPEVYAFATVSGVNVTLNSQMVENPDSLTTLTYIWSEDPNNPAKGLVPLTIGASASFAVSSSLPKGEYYFNLAVATSKGDTSRFRTYITVDSASVKAFNIKTDHAAWIDRAVIYEATPYNFVANGGYSDITNKLPDLVQLGITTLWIQPVYATHGGGQGYDVIDYFNIRSDLGPETQLRRLISSAKSYGLKVIFDFVANHSSIYHPYAVDSKNKGVNSHYYDFYQRKRSPGNIPYSNQEREMGGFVNYFWDQLPNLNYDNPEVQKWMTEAIKYWIEKYDIDGYRFDAVWGVNARKPDYLKQLRLALKRIKPEVLMLAEDKAPWPSVFDEKFDLAFDWTAPESWVSQWVWQVAYDASNVDNNRTIFNTTAESNRAAALRNSLTNNGQGYAPNAKIMRFLENNDTQHFIRHHGIERTKMAAALEFSLNGVPLIYNGQETGANLQHPYNTFGIFSPNQTIQSQDKGMFAYYQKLIQLRKNIPALYSNNYEETKVSPSDALFAFRRWQGNQNTFTVLNMGSASTTATLTIPVAKLNLDTAKIYYLSDMINGGVISGKLSQLNNVQVALNQYSAKMFLLADTAMTTTGVGPVALNDIPSKYDLAQNYPNPFNPSTTIKYSLPKNGNVTLKVYDVLGKEVATLTDGFNAAGSYTVRFDGSALPSGIYIYSLRLDGQAITKKMLLVK